MKTQSIRSLVKDITYKSKDRVDIFNQTPLEQQPIVLLRLSKRVQSDLLSNLKKEIILPILEHLDPDDATDLLQTLPTRKQNELLSEMSEELQKTISLLLQFDPKTAAGLMSLNYIQVDANQKLSDVVEQIHIHEKRTGKLPIPLILEDGKLKGFVPTQQLLFAKPTDRVSDVGKKIESIRHDAKTDTILNRFLENPHKKIVVIGDNDNILGVLYSDDVLRVLDENKTASLYNFAGLNEEESVIDSTKQKIRHRYKWLIINLATAFLASFTIGLFDKTLSKYVLLAIYMPVVAGMGGNSATQTLAVLVRGISLRQIDLNTALPTLTREVTAGLINGLINGVIVFFVVTFFNHDWKIALVLALAMIVNLMVAGFFGTLVPLVMQQLKKDPASSATIFITTATDILGFIAFLGLATLILD